MMKKAMWSRKAILAAALSVVLLMGLLCAPANAAQDAEDVTAQLSPHFTIVVDGQEREFYNVSGEEVHPILYNGSTYLPLRAIGELMDKNVDWNQSTLTVTLSGSRGGSVTAGRPDADAEQKDITVSLRYDFTVVVDGVERTFTDINGSRVYPILYNGSTYLPLRAIGNLMGKSVSWNGSTCTATLSGGEDQLVTDADTFGQAGSQGAGSQGTGAQEDIGEARAKEIALDHAGLTASQATFLYVHRDWDDGRWTYDVEFYSGATEYDYDIDAATGTILSYDRDAEHYVPAGSQSGSYIGEARAREIALDHAGLTSSQATFVRVQLEYDDGRWTYEVEFYSGATEYDYDIDAYTGAILSYDHDAEYYTPSAGGQSGSYIGEAKAREIALERAGVSESQVWGYKCELDRDDGLWKYEVEFRSGNYEYELEINAVTGAVLSYERDWD